jgi:hypothetical protein
MGRLAISKLKALGVPATLTEFPNLIHATGPAEMSAVIPEVDAALLREANSP